MTVERIEWLFVVAMLLVGISHLVRPVEWARALGQVFKTEFAGWIIAFASLPVGLILALGSRGFVWDVGLIVTIYGWALIVKSAVYLWFPRAAMVFAEGKGLTVAKSRVAGGIMIAMGLVVGAAGVWPEVFGRA